MNTYIKLLALVVICASLILVNGTGSSAKRQDKTSQMRPQQQQSRPSPDVIGYWEALKARSEKADVGSWNKNSGTPHSIFGKMKTPIAESSETSARSFLQGNGPLFKLRADTSELELTRSETSIIGKHFVFKQTYKSIQVYGAQVGVHFDSAGDIITVNNTYEPDVKIDTTEPRLSRSNAIERALLVTKLPANASTTSDLFIVPLADSSFALAWRVVAAEEGATWEVFIDAGDGRFLTQPRDINRYVNGTGQVFRDNAVVATHDNSLRDNNDAASAVPASAYSIVTLPGLDNSGNLDGVYASSSKTKKRAFSAANSFIFDRSNDGFSETMGYYYIDYAERYIQSLGFNNVNNRQQVFSVNKLKIDNSFYAPNSQEITYGLGGVDDSEDAEVILHEYGHSIQDNQVPGFGLSLEGGAMGEGFGDYWGASVGAQFSGGFQDLCLAEWDATSYSTTNPPCLRRLDGTKHYPEDVDGEVHDDGEIWSAALWQIRGAIGATNADRTIIAAHFLLSPTASFNEGANAIVVAGQNLGLGNRQLTQIRNILSARGFTITA